jgi:hypothetical protein
VYGEEKEIVLMKPAVGGLLTLRCRVGKAQRHLLCPPREPLSPLTPRLASPGVINYDDHRCVPIKASLPNHMSQHLYAPQGRLVSTKAGVGVPNILLGL